MSMGVLVSALLDLAHELPDMTRPRRWCQRWDF